MRRILRPVVFGLVVLVLLAIPVVAILARSYFLSPTAQPAKAQPIAFTHPFHVNTLGLDCTFCHRTASTQASAGVPALEQCMFCHRVVPTTNKPNLERLVQAFESNTPIQWNRVHQMPDHVKFVHSMHINAGFDCATCHGQVQQMATVEQFRDLRMGDCIDCHRQNNARTDCAVCHY
ncbi:cytochrome c3 family protein [Sphaerobacter sp.]|uniref:cytochrome c3 family protein n=1 Tax=Sphaerobacter sp. TaxID=2099654 RepID=UPI001D244519|nr:cytochrome c3 family protein [Sphaerobacter sp.]MBX5445947.1 cytochrome c3 family protein [Sphaerobacter sp.]